MSTSRLAPAAAALTILTASTARAEEPDYSFFDFKTCFTYVGQSNCASATLFVQPVE